MGQSPQIGRSGLISMILNADEILKIAEQIERNGIAFYEKAAERFDAEEERTLLGLAKMERNHEQVFAAMRRELADADEGLKAFDPEGEAEKYLAAFADGQIFDLSADPVALLDQRESVQGILELAIGLEKDSVVFYVAIKDAVPESLGKNRIDKIIKEEMDHIILLSGILSSLARQEA
jgi:rubrerythrin